MRVITSSHSDVIDRGGGQALCAKRIRIISKTRPQVARISSANWLISSIDITSTKYNSLTDGIVCTLRLMQLKLSLRIIGLIR